LLLAASLALAGCAGSGALNGASGPGLAPSPDRPGTRITVRNPDPDKWVVSQAFRQKYPDKARTMQLWVCRPLACSGNAAVAIQYSQSPTRNPDRKALEKMAKFLPAQARAQDIMMEAASDGEDRITPLSTKVTEMRGYPAIVSESKRTSKSKVNYIYRGQLFIGVIIEHVISASSDRAEAKRHFDSFVAAMEIVDVPPGEPVAAASASAALEQPTGTLQ
jgi:hypothetical protein